MDGELYYPVEFYKYEKMSDDIFILGKNAVLKFNVGLSRMQNGNRYFFYKEYEYEGKNKTPSVVIKRSYDYYMTIENHVKPQNTDKAYIRIGIKEFILFKRAIKIAAEWFTNTKFAKLFIKTRNGELSMTAPIPSHKIENLPMDKWIYLEPFIISTDISQEPGIRMTLSDDANVVDMTFDHLLALEDLLNGFNMLNTAQLMLASIPAPIGTNRVVLDDGTSANYDKYQKSAELKATSINGRKISKSIEDLEG